MPSRRESMDIRIVNDNTYRLILTEGSYSEGIISNDVEIRHDSRGLSVVRNSRNLVKSLKVDQNDDGSYSIVTEADYQAAFGLGERFDRVNQKDLSKTIAVIEKFTRQGEMTYCPVPFFFTDSGFGIYVDTCCISKFDFGADKISVDICRDSLGKLPDVYLFTGSPKEILSSFVDLTGRPVLPPKWAFGPWMSGHRWNTQALVEEQIDEVDKSGLPFSVLVIEAWSDESTFYIWNGAKYKIKPGNETFEYSDFDFSGNPYWHDPRSLIDKLHQKGIRLILWQIPAMKNTENEQHRLDCQYLRDNRLVVMSKDGTPYEIPSGNWFNGSMIPDFTNPELRKWWFSKRKYLLDMGVDGFKTDGGEFVHKEDILFSDGRTGKEMINGYVQSYLRAYDEFIGKGRVLFTRAGYTGQQKSPLTWAGDQMSTWEEFRAVIIAGLSAGLSGIPFWSFDIAGFAGPMPSVELYERATQLAVFTPGMQWHSEPIFGQFAEIMPSSGGRNDRSPWNMARSYGDDTLIERLRFHYNLRMNLLPYIYSESVKAAENCEPLMKHLFLEYPEDINTIDIEDEFMMGDLLIAPITCENSTGREVYLPRGQWIDLWSRKEYSGGRKVSVETGKERIPVFIRKGGCLILNLGNELKLGSPVGNDMDKYCNLCLLYTGNEGRYRFRDDLGNDATIAWSGSKIKCEMRSGHLNLHILS